MKDYEHLGIEYDDDPFPILAKIAETDREYAVQIGSFSCVSQRMKKGNATLLRYIKSSKMTKHGEDSDEDTQVVIKGNDSDNSSLGSLDSDDDVQLEVEEAEYVDHGRSYEQLTTEEKILEYTVLRDSNNLKGDLFPILLTLRYSCSELYEKFFKFIDLLKEEDKVYLIEYQEEIAEPFVYIPEPENIQIQDSEFNKISEVEENKIEEVTEIKTEVKIKRNKKKKLSYNDWLKELEKKEALKKEETMELKWQIHKDNLQTISFLKK